MEVTLQLHFLQVQLQVDTVVVKNVGAGTVTIARNSSNIEGSAQDGTSLRLRAKAMQVVYVDGTLGLEKEI